MTRWGAIAAIAAIIWGALPATADEAAVDSVLGARAKSSFIGISSYYGAQFDGRQTANGEIFDMRAISAASKTLPIPCYARVTNLRNGKNIVVRVNDRGPYIEGRMLDVSERVARILAYRGGLERVRLDFLGMAGPAGAADQRALMASLRNGASPVAVARAKPRDDGVSVAERSESALGFAETTRKAPAAAALEAAVLPVVDRPAALSVTNPATAPLSLAAKLDASVLRVEAALEIAHGAAERAARTLSPYGELVLSPFKAKFKPLVEASR